MRVVLRNGFTLLETLAAILVTSLIVTFALGAYVQVADTAEGATALLRDELHATTILARLSEDLQSAVLVVKPDDLDPLRHPWYFVAESREAFSGSDAIRFISRRSRSYQPDAHSSDFAQIAYQVTTDDDGLQTLHRWLLPGLPEAYDPTFPLADDERSYVLGEGLSGFSMRFRDGEGEWVETWDSTQLVQSSTLPVAIEIGFDMGEPTGDAGFDEGRYVRRLVLPMQPLDVDAMIVSAVELIAGLDSSDTDSDDDEDGEGGSSIEALIQCAIQKCAGPQASGPACSALANVNPTSVSEAEGRELAAAVGCF